MLRDIKLMIDHPDKSVSRQPRPQFWVTYLVNPNAPEHELKRFFLQSGFSNEECKSGSNRLDNSSDDDDDSNEHQLCLTVKWNDASIAEYITSVCKTRNIFEYTVEISPPTEASIKSFVYHGVPDLAAESEFQHVLPTTRKAPLLRNVSLFANQIPKKSDAKHKYSARYALTSILLYLKAACDCVSYAGSMV